MFGEVTESIDVFQKIHPLDHSAEDYCFLEEMAMRLRSEVHVEFSEVEGRGGGRAPGLGNSV